MKAYVLERPGTLSMVDTRMPKLDYDSILLKTEEVSICTTDVAYYQGDLDPPGYPITLGHEVLGEVVDVGRNGGPLKIGDRLVYWGGTDFGGLREYHKITPLLPGTRCERPWFTERNFMDDAAAAVEIVPPDTTIVYPTLLELVTGVLRALLTHPLQPGQDAIVLGAGPVGLCVSQVLKRLQAAHSVTVLDQNSERLAVAASLGADHVFNVRTQAAELEQLSMDSHGTFGQYVFDALPDISKTSQVRNTRTTAMQLLAPKGRYVIFGATTMPQLIDTWPILSKGLTICAAPFDVRGFSMWRSADIMQVAKNILGHSLINTIPIISHVIDFYDDSGIQAAFEEHGEGVRLKTLVKFS